MNYIIAVFRSRAETLQFASVLKSYGVATYIINTPRKASVSCGISCKFESGYMTLASNIISRRNFASFAGFYKLIYSPDSHEINVLPV